MQALPRWITAFCIAMATFAAAGHSQKAHAHDFRIGDLVIDHPYATPSQPESTHGTAHFRSIRNRGRSMDRLVAASTPAAARVELHETIMEGGVMTTREVEAIELPARQTIRLRHDGRFHLKLVDLERPLAAGDRFDLSLRFERAGETKVRVWVQQPRTSKDHQEHRH
jgi:copper(I)-binding protein